MSSPHHTIKPLIANPRASVRVLSNEHDDDSESFDIEFNHETDDSKTMTSPLRLKSKQPMVTSQLPSSQLIKTSHLGSRFGNNPATSHNNQSTSSETSLNTTTITSPSKNRKRSASVSSNRSSTTPNTKSSLTSPAKAALPQQTLSLFNRLLPNQQISQRHLQQLQQPITLPNSLPLQALSPPTQQLANFLIDHLQSQQGHLASLQKDVYGMRDVVWAGGLVLQKQQKQLHSLHSTVDEHEVNIQQLRDDLLHQEARLRTEIIYQQQQQVLQKIRFDTEQRQTRIDNLFDGTILLTTLILTGLSPISTINSTFASLFVSGTHLFIRHIIDRHPYTFERLSPPVDLTLPQPPTPPPPPPQPQSLQPISTMSSPIAQITQQQQQFKLEGNPSWNQWTQPPAYSQVIYTPHGAIDPNAQAPSSRQETPKIILSEAQRYRKRRFRTALARGAIRTAEIIYLFIVFRKFLVNLGFIQSPLVAYLRAILPPQVYDFLMQLSIGKIQRTIVAPFDWVMSLGEKKPYKTFPDDPNSPAIDQTDGKPFNQLGEPMSKDEIFNRVFQNLKHDPSLAQSLPDSLQPTHSSNTNLDSVEIDIHLTTNSNTNSSFQHTTHTSPIQQTMATAAINSVLPSWMSDYVSPFADKVVSTLNPFSPPPYKPISHPPGLNDQGDRSQTLFKPSLYDANSNQYNPYGYDFTTQQLLQPTPYSIHNPYAETIPAIGVVKGPNDSGEAMKPIDDGIDNTKYPDNTRYPGSNSQPSNPVGPLEQGETIIQTENPKSSQPAILGLFDGVTKMFDDLFFD